MTTPSQTIGPFFGFALTGEDSGGPLRIEGTVFDGARDPVTDALIELWDGSHFARCPTDEQGRFSFATERPAGACIDVSVFARGLLQRLVTRIYLRDDPADPVLAGLGDRRSTLLALEEGGTLRFDIHLQGDDETVFFAI